MQKRRKHQSKKEKGTLGRRLRVALQLVFLLILLAIAGGIFYFYHQYGKIILELQSQAKKAVRASTEETFRATQTSIVYDTEGNLISTLKAEKDVYYIEYEDIPTTAIDAMVVSEDRKFLEHGGVDYLANIRAAMELIKNKGEITQGASTITQQLARNVFLTHQVTYERKIEEIFMAQELEKKYTKYDILEFYLNGIYFANGHYGIQAAAQGYFGEGVTALSLSQIIFLCAIPNNPNRYNPVTNMANTLERRDRILAQLQEDGRISLAEYKKAIAEKIVLHTEKADKKNYVETYVYYSAIRALMKQQGFEFRYQFEDEADLEAYEEAYYDLYYRDQKDLYLRGYRIYTSIDLNKQELLQKVVDRTLSDFKETNEEGVYQMQGAAVCIDNDNGKVVAIVGGRDQDLKGYTLNRGYQSYRQPGSAIKPLIVYTPAFERSYTPDSIVIDEKTEDGPKNAEGGFAGKMKFQRAIELSKNTIAWKLFEELTPEIGLSYLRKMNFAKITDSDYVPAASLGGLTLGASPVEMAAAYSAIENDGYYREPTCIVKIMDAEGNEIVGDQTEKVQVYQTKAARIMTEALTGVMENGTAKGLGLSNTMTAGKTGTTNEKKDGWFVGYSPYYTTSVWVGYDLPKTVEDLKGATYPGTIWHDFMEKLHTSSMTKEFSLYDWRAELKKAKDEAKRLEEEKKAAAEAAAGDADEDTTAAPDTDADSQEGADTESENTQDADNTGTDNPGIDNAEPGDESTASEDADSIETDPEDDVIEEEPSVDDNGIGQEQPVGENAANESTEGVVDNIDYENNSDNAAQE